MPYSETNKDMDSQTCVFAHSFLLAWILQWYSRHFLQPLCWAPTTSGPSQLLASGGDRSSCLRKLAAEGSAEEARRSVASAHRQQQRALLWAVSVWWPWAASRWRSLEIWLSDASSRCSRSCWAAGAAHVVSSTWQGLAYGEQLGPCRVEGHPREGTVLAKIGIQLANLESWRQQMWACHIQPVILCMESLPGKILVTILKMFYLKDQQVVCIGLLDGASNCHKSLLSVAVMWSLFANVSWHSAIPSSLVTSMHHWIRIGLYGLWSKR